MDDEIVLLLLTFLHHADGSIVGHDDVAAFALVPTSTHSLLIILFLLLLPILS